MNNLTTTQQRDHTYTWFRTVCKVTVGDVTAGFPDVLTIDHTTPVSEALSMLEENEIQSLAVCGPPHSFLGAGGGELIAANKQYIGIISIVDLLAFSLKHRDFLTQKVSNAIGSTNESLSLWCEASDQPLYFAMEQFVKGVHHALVRPANDTSRSLALKYLSQTDIVGYLLSDISAMPHLEALLAQPVGDMATMEVVSVRLTTPLNEAIALLVEHSALPVVNEAGVVVSNMSASDFKGKSTTALRESPDSTVMDLLLHQALSLSQVHKPLTVPVTACLYDAAMYMLEHRVHRLWVIPALSEEQQGEQVLLDGLGVLTLTDILRAVYISEK